MRKLLLLLLLTACGPSAGPVSPSTGGGSSDGPSAATPEPAAPATSSDTASDSAALEGPASSSGTAAPSGSAGPAGSANASSPQPKLQLPFDISGRGRPVELQAIEQLNDAGKSRQAKAQLTKLLAGQEQLPLHVRLHAHAALGRAEAKLSRSAAADKAYRRVLELTQSEAEVIKALSPGLIAHVRYAQGEALFHFAENERRKVEALKLPQMAGAARDEKALDKLINTKFKPWLAKKRAAIEKADRAYLEIIRIESPPPGWMVAAAARVGDMWLDFSQTFFAVPYPKVWDSKGFVPGSNPPVPYAELRANYQKAIVAVTEPQRQHALAAYKKCIEISESLTVHSQHTQHCYAQAAKLSKPTP